MPLRCMETSRLKDDKKNYRSRVVFNKGTGDEFRVDTEIEPFDLDDGRIFVLFGRSIRSWGMYVTPEQAETLSGIFSTAANRYRQLEKDRETRLA